MPDYSTLVGGTTILTIGWLLVFTAFAIFMSSYLRGYLARRKAIKQYEKQYKREWDARFRGR